MTFLLAFLQARKKGLKTFNFRGKTFHTKTTEEMKVPTRVGYESKKIEKMLGINPALLQVFNADLAKNWMHDLATVDRMLLTPGLFVDNEGVTNTNMAELYVNAPRLKIDPNNKKTLFGLTPFESGKSELKGRTWQDYNTGLVFVTDNKGNIIGSTMSEDAAKEGRFSHYYGGQQKDADRLAHISDALDLVNKHSARVGNGITKKELIEDINDARSKFAYGVSSISRTPFRGFYAALRTARPDYTWKDFSKEMTLRNWENSGLGDVVGGRFKNELNMLGDAALLSTIKGAPTYINKVRGNTVFGRPGNFIGLTNTNGMLVENVPTTTTRGNRIIVTPNPRGGTPSVINTVEKQTPSFFDRALGQYRTGNTYRLGTETSLTTRNPYSWQRGPLMAYNEGQLRINGYKFGDPTTLPVLTYSPTSRNKSSDTIDRGHVESPFISKWQREWIERGEMPETNATRWNESPREGVFNTDNTYWRGLSGEGKRYNSALSNTYNNGQGFTVGYKKGGKTKLIKKGDKVCPKCGKIHSARMGCSVAKFKIHRQGGSLV